MEPLQRGDRGLDGGSGATAAGKADWSAVSCDDCGEMLHGLNNALASVLLNAQVMAWKLPSYSRSKRYLREIERNAQRGGELVKRLMERSHAGCRAVEAEAREGAEPATLIAGLDAMVQGAERAVAITPAEGRAVEP